MVTAIATVCAAGRGSSVRRWLRGWLLSLVWCWRFGGGGMRGGVWILVHVIVALVVVARHTGLIVRGVHWLDARLESPRSPRAVLGAWVVLAFLPGVIRAGLLLLGFRESIQIGQRFALTLVHVPFGLLVEALYLLWLWRRQRGRGHLLVVDLLPALAIVLGTWVLPAMLVSDLGLALLNVPVFLIALVTLVVGVTLRGREDGFYGGSYGRQRAVVALPVAALVAYLLFAAFPIGARALLAVIPEQATVRLESERNYLRLLDRAYPKTARRGGAARQRRAGRDVGGHAQLHLRTDRRARVSGIRDQPRTFGPRPCVSMCRRYSSLANGACSARVA